MFKLDNVRYKDIVHVKRLDIAGEGVTCFVGKSGGGKTTILKLLNKLISPTEGSITYHGEALDTIDSVAHRKRVIMLRQKPYIFSGTIKENLLIATRLHQVEVSEEAMKSALEAVQLQRDLDRNAKTLSGGEAQRLALARIMLLNPECILLDEPSSALDEATEKFIIETIVRHVREKKCALVMVTHAEAVAKRFGDYIFNVSEGHIAEVK